MIKLKNYRQLSEHYQSFLYQRFIDTSQSEKFGYPKVIDSIEISSIILRYDDILLSNYYFPDPQYLAELLVQLIAIEQTNGLARHGYIERQFIF
ncbi:unnamed protein product [Rotaria sp. Silwood1]|nr:unnamed protein product [Rotaria sp. Silwood1]